MTPAAATTVRHPLNNRVTPAGELIAVTSRGTFMGNRGVTHDRHGRIVRHHRGKLWAICRTEFNGRWRAVRTPGRLTEMFFLDEPTALAAGHRPCGMCRHDAYVAYRSHFRTVTGQDAAGAADIDECLHRERLGSANVKLTWSGRADQLPDGAVVTLENAYWLVAGDELLEWTPSGYGRRRERPRDSLVTVLTPRTTCDVLTNGYVPALHPSAVIRH